MTVTELELRLNSIEQELARLATKVDTSTPENPNAWIDQIHNTFQNDAAYRQAAKAGREWRKSHRPAPAGRRAKKPVRK
jgi:hypothetical protein